MPAALATPVVLDRIHRIDRPHIVGSINPVNPVYIDKVEQIGVDRTRDVGSIVPDPV